mmetsp:Transcript_3723/g.5807  ORF Transcript_3723/g.5807 Transcript_3723/m.5807 type:complete len:213 (+) Transcript_3723:430-1068(+)
MTLQLHADLLLRPLPKQHILFRTRSAGHDQFPIAGHGAVIDTTRVTGESIQAHPTLRIPNFQGLVVRGRDELPRLRSPAYRVHRVRVLPKDPSRLESWRHLVLASKVGVSLALRLVVDTCREHDLVEVGMQRPEPLDVFWVGRIQLFLQTSSGASVAAASSASSTGQGPVHQHEWICHLTGTGEPPAAGESQAWKDAILQGCRSLFGNAPHK